MESHALARPMIVLPRGVPLLERDAELAVIDGLVRELPAGEARVLLLEGEAGIGKSRLLAELRERASDGGARVLTARGSELERSFSFGVVRQLFEAAVLEQGEAAFAGAAAGARPIFGPPSEEAPQGADDGSFAALHGLYWLTVNLTSSVPLVLAIDDLHWADRASLRFLPYLVRRFEGLPLLVAATLRLAEQPSDPALVAELGHDLASITVRPGPLSTAAAATVVEHRLGAAAEPAFVEATRKVTGGNPLLLHEVLRALEAEGVEPVDARADAVAELAPRAVTRAVLLRLSRLDPGAVAVARALAILGEGAPLPQIAALAGRSEQDAGRALVELARAEIVRQEPPLGFAHPLLGDAVYRDIPVAERELAHARVARLLSETAAGDELVAAHLLLAPAREDAWAVERLQGAARTAVARGDADSAAAFLARALAEPPPDGLRAPLRFQLGVAEAFSNGPAAVVHLREAYEEAGDPVLRATIALVLANISIFTEGPAAVARLTTEAAANAPSPELRSLLEAIGMTTAYWHPALRSEPLFARLRRGEVEPGPGGAMKLAMAAYDWSMRGGTADDCVALAQQALQDGHLLRHDNGGTSVVAALLVLAMADHGDAERLVDDSFRAAHAHGSLLSSCAAFVFGGYTALLRGELAESERLLHTAIEQIESWGFDTVRAYPYCFLADLELERGNVAAAAEAVERAGLPPGPPVNVHTGWWAATRLRLLVAEGAQREAVALADEAIARLGAQVANPAAHPWWSLRARALSALGRTAEADASAAEQVRLARIWGGPRGLAEALRVLASVRRDEAVALLSEAVAAVEDSTARLEHARSLAALGTALRHDGRTAEAREPLRLALELAEVCGASMLRRAGAQRAPRRRRPAAQRRVARPRFAHPERAPGRRAGGDGPDQPRHRAGPLRHAEDGRGAPLERLPQARDPLEARARARPGLGDPLDRRRRPAAVDRVLLGPVDAQDQVERPGWGGEPVGRSLAVGAVVLQPQLERAVVGVHEPVAVADRVAVDRVVDEVVALVVHRERPERPCRRRLADREAQPVAALAVQRGAGAVGEGVGVERVLAEVRTEAEQGDRRAARVVGAVVTRVAADDPAVDRGRRPGGGGANAFEACADSRVEGRRRAGLGGEGARPQAELGEPVEQRRVGGRRRVVRQQRRQPGQEGGAVHRGDRLRRRGGRPALGLRDARRLEDDRVLEAVDVLVVGRAVGLGAADEPGQGGRGAQLRRSVRQRAVEARPDDRERAAVVAGGAAARGGEDVRPGREQRHEVVAPAARRQPQDRRAGRQVEARERVQRVRVRADDVGERRVGERPPVTELVGRAHRPQRQVHEHQRVAVDERLGRQLGRPLLHRNRHAHLLSLRHESRTFAAVPHPGRVVSMKR